MITIKNKTIGEFNRGEITLKQIGQELLDKYPVTEIAETLAEILVNPNIEMDVPRIAVTQEELDRLVGMFRVKQVGTGRGRKPKNSQ